MSFLKHLFRKKEAPIKTYSDFWNWFQLHEKSFFAVVKKHTAVEKEFFDKLSPTLEQIKDGIFFTVGMFDDNTAELILTADGDTKNIVFVEELIEAAPEITGWKFVALKQTHEIENVNISMAGLKFTGENLFFYPNVLPAYPDEIDITVVHADLNEENKKSAINGVYIFLDHCLGELDFVNNIDSLKVIGINEAQQELIPIAKLRPFLTWRQKEFIEKYQGVRHNTDEDNYSMMEAELESGNMLVALMNTDLLNWDSKASHPWIAVFTLKYNGSKNNGMPNDKDYELLTKIEDEITFDLKDVDGYLNIGRQTANGEREIYFACKDFRKPSKVFFNSKQVHSARFEIEYEIYKDKYWQTFERFNKK